MAVKTAQTRIGPASSPRKGEVSSAASSFFHLPSWNLIDRRILNMRRDFQRSLEVNTKVLTVLALSFASVAVADDFKTTDGKEYKDATVSRIEPHGIVVKTKTGVSKLYFA